MGDLVRVGLPYVLSAITIWMTLMAGNKHPKAWLIGLANQALWLVWIVTTGSWGLLPMNLALWFVYGRNHLKWRRSEPAAASGPVIRVDREGVAYTRRVVLKAGSPTPSDGDG